MGKPKIMAPNTSIPEYGAEEWVRHGFIVPDHDDKLSKRWMPFPWPDHIAHYIVVAFPSLMQGWKTGPE